MKRSFLYMIIGLFFMSLIFPIGIIPNSTFGDWNFLRDALLMTSFLFGMGILGGGAMISGSIDDEIHFIKRATHEN